MRTHSFLKMLLVLVAALAIVSVRGASRAAELVDVAKVNALSKPLFDEKWLFGASVGFINEKGTQIVGYGKMSDSDATAPGPETVFEIGSISKVFTGLILARMVADGQVKLDEPVQKLLGDSMTVPKWEDRQITLVDLATHTSGLPRMPMHFNPKDPTNPYADYTVEQLAKFLAGHKLKYEPGKHAEYSNLAVGLLGHALARSSGMSYEELLRKMICEPLAMNDTRITLDADEKTRLAQGHDEAGEAAPNWDLPTLAGAGAIRSTAADMLKFLAANIGLTKTSFEAALANSQAVHYEAGKGSPATGLAWVIEPDGVIWHNGGTGGYHSFACFSRDKRAGVVVLSNSSAMRVDNWGRQLFKLLTTGDAEPLKLPKTVQVEAAVLDALAGKYQLTPQATVVVARDGDHLLMQVTGQPQIAFYPESKTRFNCRIVEAAVTFEAGEDGSINKLVIHQNGRDVPATRAK